MLLFSVALMAASAAATLPPAQSSDRSRTCPHTTGYLARDGGMYRGKPLTPKKLTQLPPATTFMAVYRHIGTCDAPLTMVEYRQGLRR